MFYLFFKSVMMDFKWSWKTRCSCCLLFMYRIRVSHEYFYNNRTRIFSMAMIDTNVWEWRKGVWFHTTLILWPLSDLSVYMMATPLLRYRDESNSSKCILPFVCVVRETNCQLSIWSHYTTYNGWIHPDRVYRGVSIPSFETSRGI